MNDKLRSTLEKIEALAKQNPEFALELQKIAKCSSLANSAHIDDSRMDHIYEYCIEEKIDKQAHEFYDNFPCKKIVDKLIGDYKRMEYFRRKDNFEDFCLSLYQQIECITNFMCSLEQFQTLVYDNWESPAYINSTSDFTIAQLVFGKSKASEKSKKELKDLFATELMGIVLYFFGFFKRMKYTDYDRYKGFVSKLYDIYQCRNMNHREGNRSTAQQETLDRILPYKSMYYFCFMGILAQFVDEIRKLYQA